MSMVRCSECEHVFSSDDDPDCFVNEVTATSIDIVLCQWCRDRHEAANELAEGPA